MRIERLMKEANDGRAEAQNGSIFDYESVEVLIDERQRMVGSMIKRFKGNVTEAEMLGAEHTEHRQRQL